MTSGVSTTSTAYDYDAAMESIRADVEAYCESVGLDSEEFLANLDGSYTASVVDVEALNKYFELCYVQLVQTVDPEAYYAAEAQVASGEFDSMYDAIQAQLTADEEQFFTDMINDDPELLALYAMEAGGQSEYDYVMSQLDTIDYAGTGINTEEYIDTFTDDAEAINAEYGLGIDGYIESEQTFVSAMMSIEQSIEDYDMAVAALIEDFSSGEIDETTFNAQLDELTYGRETLMAMLQQLNESYMSFFEMISKLFNSMFEAEAGIVTLWKV